MFRNPPGTVEREMAVFTNSNKREIDTLFGNGIGYPNSLFRCENSLIRQLNSLFRFLGNSSLTY
jgi:hypothetical protein